MNTVFNAALVMSACVLIKQRVDFNGSVLSLPDTLDISGRPLHAAVDALLLLDTGNRMVEKCAAFLNRLSQVLSSIGESVSDIYD